MKTMLLAGVAALSVLGVSAASAQPVPVKYRGLWCFNKNATYLYRCREANDESYQYIGRNDMKISEEGSCPIIVVKPTAKGHRVSVDCPPGVASDPPKYTDLWLDARGRLHMKDIRGKSKLEEKEYVLFSDIPLYSAAEPNLEETPERYRGTLAEMRIVKIVSRRKGYCLVIPEWDVWVLCKDLFEVPK
jgi:hypothetical protein